MAFLDTIGEAGVFIDTAGGGRRSLNVLSRGNFFGEMRLMTGSPQVAPAIARTDPEYYRLGKEALHNEMHHSHSEVLAAFKRFFGL